MSRGRKSQYVTKITVNDEKMMKAFSRVGYMNHTMLRENLGMAERRIAGFQRDGYIEKVSHLEKTTKNATFAYRLTEKGKGLCEKLGVDQFYRSSSPGHDLGLAEKYLGVQEELRDSWICEGEWRNRFETYLTELKESDKDRWEELSEKWGQKLISPPDGGYVSEAGVEIAIEIVTSSYRETDIEAKEIFTQAMNIEYEQTRV